MKIIKRAITIQIIVLFFIMLFSFTARIHAEGLSTLAEVGKDQAAMQKALDEETKSFRAIRKAIEKGTINKGESQDAIKRSYGEPVIILPDKKHDEKWIYKPGYASWFDGIKIYLYFDSDKKLEGIKQF